ncbi:MAG: plasmid pRiA4b ORF-3 family protein, partial [Actinomycetota bacterium]
IASTSTFMNLHDAIQLACSWQDYHLFLFRDFNGATIAGLPDAEGFEEPEPEAALVKLSSFFAGDVRKCVYEYDFGDSWEHNVVLVGTVELKELFRRRLIDGERAFPPEDCGGISGYEDCVKVSQGSTEETIIGPASELRIWLGDWDSEYFDLAETKKIFDR